MTMSPHLRVLGIFAAITITIARAAPSILQPRGRSTTEEPRKDLDDFFTNFSPDSPTCANDQKLAQCLLPDHSTADVTVQPDCDVVIDYICAAVDKMSTMPPETRDMRSLTYSTDSGTCEGKILFADPKLADPVNYATCVQGFQSITTTCMLIDGKTKNQASAGQQAGVMNIFHRYKNEPPKGIWQASTAWGNMPGYMMGPNWYWGPVHAMAAQDVAENGTTYEYGIYQAGAGQWWH